MEEEDPMTKNKIEDDGISVADNVLEDMIEEDGIGIVDQDDHDNGTSTFDNDDEDGLDIPILKKAYKTLYQGSETTLLFSIVLLVNLKVLNGLSNVAISLMVRYTIFSIFNVSIPLLFIILTTHIFCYRLIGEFLLPPSNILPRSY